MSNGLARLNVRLREAARQLERARVREAAAREALEYRASVWYDVAVATAGVPWRRRAA